VSRPRVLYPASSFRTPTLAARTQFCRGMAAPPRGLLSPPLPSCERTLGACLRGMVFPFSFRQTPSDLPARSRLFQFQFLRFARRHDLCSRGERRWFLPACFSFLLPFCSDLNRGQSFLPLFAAGGTRRSPGKFTGILRRRVLSPALSCGRCFSFSPQGMSCL